VSADAGLAIGVPQDGGTIGLAQQRCRSHLIAIVCGEGPGGIGCHLYLELTLRPLHEVELDKEILVTWIGSPKRQGLMWDEVSPPHYLPPVRDAVTIRVARISRLTAVKRESIGSHGVSDE
jgi:hypothetical protein